MATVAGKKITQQMIDITRIDSTFSENEMLEKLIDDELLLIKAEEIKISVSDKEAKLEAKKQKKMLEDMLENADNKSELKTSMDELMKLLGISEKEYWNSYVVQGYKKALTVAKVRGKLGSDTQKTLKGLRIQVNIRYYN